MIKWEKDMKVKKTKWDQAKDEEVLAEARYKNDKKSTEYILIAANKEVEDLEVKYQKAKESYVAIMKKYKD